MVILNIISYCALLFIIACCVLFFIKPIERDRILARGIKTTIAMVFTIIIIVPFAVHGIAILMGLNSSQIAGGQNGFGSKELFISILYHFTDPGNLQEATSVKGLIIAWVSALLGIFLFAGLMVSTFVSIMDKRTDLWRKGLLRYKRNFRNYVVIIGGNEQLVSIIKKSLLSKDVKYVLILTSQDVEKLRMRIESRLTSREERKVVMYYGDMTSFEEIKGLHIKHAKEIYILGESIKDDINGDHDAFSMNCLQHISTYLTNHKIGRKILCHVAIEHQSTYTMLKYTDLGLTLNNQIEFLPFNIYEQWAKRVIVDNKAIVKSGKNSEQIKEFTYLPLGSKEGIGLDSEKRVHIVIIGMNEMGTGFAMEAAQLMHFPNFTRNHSLRTTITFIDNKAKEEADFLKGRYANIFELSRSRTIIAEQEEFDKEWYDPMQDRESRYYHLGENFMDIQWEFIQGNIAAKKIRQYITAVAVDPTTICSIVVCDKHPQKSLATALYLPEMVLKRAEQILVYQSNMSDIINKLSVGDKIWKRYGKLRPFGMLENCYEDISLDNTQAKLLNWFYSCGGDQIDENLTYNEIADKVNELWQNKSIAFKWSSILNVNSFAQKLRAAGSDIDDSYENQKAALNNERLVKALALTEHNRWVTERLTMGFRPLDNTDNEWGFFNCDRMINPANQEIETEKSKKKDYWKAKSRAHLDICSNETLAIIDSKSPQNDLKLVLAIPMILKLSHEAENTT